MTPCGASRQTPDERARSLIHSGEACERQATEQAPRQRVQKPPAQEKPRAVGQSALVRQREVQ